MHAHRVLVSAASVVLLAGATGAGRASYMTVEATCIAGDSLRVSWTFHETSPYPGERPERVGYDLLRRSLTDCEPIVRVNDAPFPRVPSQTHGHTYTEVAPAQATTYQYRVVLVDADHQPVTLDPATCDPCNGLRWTACPEYSAPVTVGRLEDWGWALFIQPCAEGCYPMAYFSDPWDDELRAYAGTGTVVRFYGGLYYGTVGGCALAIDRYEFGPCGPTPAVGVTWGRLKTLYR